MIKVFFLLSFLMSMPLWAQNEVESQYPFFRQFRSSFNLTFGAISLLKSNQVLQDDEASAKEKDYAKILTGIGVLRVADGIYYLIRPSLPEIYLEKGYLTPDHPEYKMRLSEAADFERKLRKYRAGVIFLNGVGFLGIYNEDPQRNSLAILPGIGMLIVSAYAFFGKAPAEKQLERERMKVSFNFEPYKHDSKVTFYPTLNISF